MSKMKKICISFLFLILLCTSQVLAIEDYNKENKKREDAYNKALSQLLEPYKSENTPEEKRIIDYRLNRFAMDDSEEGRVSASISFEVTPYSEENTIWKNNRQNMCFAQFVIIDGEYIVESVSEYPPNYDKFLERFEEYQKNKEQIEVQSVQAEQTNNMANQEIEKMNNVVFYSCLAIFIFIVIFIILNLIKIKRMKELNIK